MVCATSKGSDQPAHTRSLFRAFASHSNIVRLSVKLLSEHYLEFLSLKGGYTCQNATLLEITCHGSHVKMIIKLLTFTSSLGYMHKSPVGCYP